MYTYNVKHSPGKAHCNADALSRLPLPDCPESTPVPAEVVLMLEKIDSTPITVSQIHTWARRDPLLSKVYCYVQFGWPTSVPAELQPYFVNRDELSSTECCGEGGWLFCPQGGSHCWKNYLKLIQVYLK